MCLLPDGEQRLLILIALHIFLPRGRGDLDSLATPVETAQSQINLLTALSVGKLLRIEVEIHSPARRELRLTCSEGSRQAST